MNTYHVVDKLAYQTLAHIADESHYIDLPDGKVLVVARFRDANHQDTFVERTGAESLPHPLSSETMQDHQDKYPDHKKILDDLGVDTKPTDRMYDVAKQLGKIHPLFKFHG
jgi:hypothetical protein